MKYLKTYTKFNESVEEIMNQMVSDTDVEDINKTIKQLEKTRDNMLLSKKKLEISLENLEKLQLDTFTEFNQKDAEQKKKDVQEAIDQTNEELKKMEEQIKDFKDKTQEIKK